MRRFICGPQAKRLFEPTELFSDAGIDLDHIVGHFPSKPQYRVIHHAQIEGLKQSFTRIGTTLHLSYMYKLYKKYKGLSFHLALINDRIYHSNNCIPAMRKVLAQNSIEKIQSVIPCTAHPAHDLSYIEYRIVEGILN